MLTVALAVCTLMAVAQQEQHRFKNRQFMQLYTQANRSANTPEGRHLADSLLKLATIEGDTYSQLMAMSVRTRYDFDHVASYDQFRQTVQPMMDLAQREGDYQFYYAGVSYLSTFLVNRTRLDEALDIANRQMDFATSHQHYHGMAICHLTLGNIFWVNKQMAEAINEYKLSIECFEKSPQRRYRNFAVANKMIADSYLTMGQFKELLQTADDALNQSQPEQVANGMYGYRAFALFMLDRDADFLKAYQQFMSHQTERAEIQEGVPEAIHTMKLIIEGHDSEVERLINQYHDNYFFNFVNIAYRKRKMQYVLMLDAMQQFNIKMYGIKGRSMLTTLHFASAQIGNRLKEIEKQKAEYALTHAQLTQTLLKQQQADLELKHTKEKEQLALVDAENDRLTYGNSQLTTRHLQDSVSHQRLHLQARQQQMDTRNIMLATIVALIILLTAITYGQLRKNKRLSRQLRDNHNLLEHTRNELAVANDMAQQSDGQKTRFIQAMSHEIRTPLNAIVGFTQVLTEMEDDITEEETTRIIKQITDNSETLSVLVNSILDLTNIESGKYSLRHDAIRVNHLCRSVILETRYMKQAHVALNYQTDINDDYEIVGDSMRIQQVLNNMLTNAMKNTEQGSITLHCSTQPEQQTITFTVTDTGCGIPKDKQEIVFERFMKLDSFKQGVGLGLEICRTIARKMGGSFILDGNYSKGARFVFTIPTKIG